MMKALVLSGGASKGAFTAGVVEYLLRKEKMDFQLAVGTSTGSLVGGPALLGDYNYLANIYTTVANDDILDNSFIGKLVGSPIDASMEPLHKLLKKYYLDQGRLQEIIDAPDKTLVVSLVNVHTGKVHLVSSDQVGNQAGQIKPVTFVRAVLASCSEPVFTEPVQVYQDEPNSEFRQDLFYDGGVKEFLPLEEAIRRGAEEVWAVSTHRLEHSETDWGGGTNPTKVSVFKALLWTITSTLDEVARGDRYRAQVSLRSQKALELVSSLASSGKIDDTTKKQLLEKIRYISDIEENEPGFEHLYLIYPEKSMHTSLDFKESIMFGYFRDGRKAAEAFINKGRPEFTDDTLKDWVNQVLS
jgi:NTE family protein